MAHPPMPKGCVNVVPFAGPSIDMFGIDVGVGLPPEQVARVWEVVRAARDAVVATVQGAVAAGRPIAGFEADRAARGVIEAAGLWQPSAGKRQAVGGRLREEGS